MENYHQVPNIDTDTLSQYTIDIASSSKSSPSLSDTKYIKVFGKPPENSETRQTPNDYILKSESPDELIDVLDALNEEPFTLETLEDLIQIHWENNVDFVLARVTTVDPNDDAKFYYSYYAAHHINKVLFRTQPEEGLLHRMKARNPLNNMTIVGDVHYYVIKAVPVQKAPKSPLEHIKDLVYVDKNVTARSNQIINHFTIHKPTFFERIFDRPRVEFLIKPQLYEEFELKPSNTRRSSFDDAYSDPNPLNSHSSNTTIVKQNRHRNVRSIAFANEKTDLMTVDEWIHSKTKVADAKSLCDPDSPRKRHTRTIAPVQKPIQFYEAHYFASDDDFLMHSSVRKYFKHHCVESDDGVLFTIQNVSSSEQGEEHPTLANLAFLLGENDERQQRMRRRLKYIVILYAIFSFALLKFVGNSC